MSNPKPESPTSAMVPRPAGAAQPAGPSAGKRLFMRRVLKLTGALALALFLCTGASLLAAYAYIARDLPTGSLFGAVLVKESTKIYDRNGGLLFEALDPQGGRRVVVQPEQIPAVLKKATIATEDPSFYNNWGVDPVGVARAIYYNLRGDRGTVGGSTITQQLVKNGLLSPDQTIERKLNEAVLAVEVTRRFPKDQILTAYLNSIYYGNRSYGIQAASQSYFNKNVQDLNLAEASLLAGLPQAPSIYDPCQDDDAALDRQSTVLNLMVKAGYITAADQKNAEREMTVRLKAPEFDKQCNKELKVTLRAPHFVQWVTAQLEQRYGPEVMYKGGLRVTTTLDPAVQAVVEEEARKQIAALQDKGASNTAVVAMRPATGEVVAMIGSVDYNNKDIAGQVNVADRLRQPGSSIKPINYVTAFAHGWTPATPVYDLSTNFPEGGRPPYVPVDYDHKERGLVSVRFALANSLNIPAVKALYLTSEHSGNSTGAPLAMMTTARNLGISSFHNADGTPKPFGLALTLGAGEVKLTELTGAYAAFANGGARMPATPFLKIVDADGRVLVDLAGKDKPKAVCAKFDPAAQNEQPDAKGACPQSAPFAYLITNILADNQARKAAFGENNPLAISRPAAVKTGTTDSYKDNWTLGYTSDLVVGVWMGNSNNVPMQAVPGSLGAAPIWHNVMERVLNDVWKIPSHDFAMPANVKQVEICAESGLLPSEACPADHRHKEFFVAGYEPKDKDTVWTHITCTQGNRDLGVFMQPVHDVGDLIPYDQILRWAGAAGWRVAPQGETACAAAPVVVPQAPPQNHPQNNNGNGNHDNKPPRGGKKGKD